MKVLVLGRNGMLGHQVLKVGKELGIDVEGVGRDEFEAETFMKNAFFDFERFDWVINCIGVVKPLSEPLKSISVNALFPNYLARHLKNNYPKTRLIHISTDCFVGNTKVLTKNGYINIKDIKVGDYVYTHKGRLKKVYDLIEKQNFDRELLELKFHGSKPIKCTVNHPFYVVRHNKRENVNLNKKEWVNAEDLTINDLIVVPKLKFNEPLEYVLYLNNYMSDYQKTKQDEYNKVMSLNNDYNFRGSLKQISKETGVPYSRVHGWTKGKHKPKILNPKNIEYSKDLFWLFGVYVAEGWTQKSRSKAAVYFCYGDEPDLIDKTQKSLKKIFGLESTVKKLKNQKGSHVIVYNNILSNLFSEWFYNSKDKYSHTITFPLWFNSLDDDLKSSFIKGYFDGDGCYYVGKNSEFISFGSVSEELIDRFKILLNSLGLIGRVSIRKKTTSKINGRIIKGKKFYNLTIGGKQVDIIKDLMGIKTSSVNAYNTFFEDDNNFYLPLRNIRHEKSDELVYNIEVEDDHSYLIDGMLSAHNCVFDAVTGHYDEDSQYSANDLYGMSKALGEVKDMDNTLTIRTSIIGREMGGNKRGLIEWVLSNPDGGSINGYTNHYWSGVTTRELAFRMFQIVGKYPDVHGLKVVASPTINKYDLVSMIVEEFSRDIKVVPHEAKPSIDRGMYQSNSLRDVYRRNGLREQIKDLVENG